MFEVKFLDRKTNEIIYRNYKWKGQREIEAIARKKKWIIARIKREL